MNTTGLTMADGIAVVLDSVILFLDVIQNL